MWKLTSWFAIVFLVMISASPLNKALAHPETSPSLQSAANDLIAEVNALRIENGLPAYTVNSILMQVAQDQANYMAATGQVAHRPGLTQRILDARYPLAGNLSLGGFRAENITGGNKTAAQAIQEWTGDALHTNTMLSPNLTEIGAGVAKVGNSYYMVIDCALPTTSGQPQVYSPGLDDTDIGPSAPSEYIVPIIVSTPDENGFVYHEVQYGHTLWGIAIEYGVKIDDIRALNNLGTATEIYQGDRLLVRKDAPPPPATVTPVNVIAPTVPDSISTFTPFPTITPIITATAIMMTEHQQKNSVTGSAIGIVLVTLLLAGMFTWMVSQKPV